MSSEKAKQIRRAFRALMNGVTAQSMREKGLDYHLTWGAQMTDLLRMAEDYEPDASLAQELWDSKIRESRIMAMLLMPKGEMTLTQALEWSERIDTHEMAELASMHLFQWIEEAESLAANLLQDDNNNLKICGFHVISRLLIRKEKLKDETRDLVKINAEKAMLSNDMTLKHAAYNCLVRVEEQ